MLQLHNLIEESSYYSCDSYLEPCSAMVLHRQIHPVHPSGSEASDHLPSKPLPSTNIKSDSPEPLLFKATIPHTTDTSTEPHAFPALTPKSDLSEPPSIQKEIHSPSVISDALKDCHSQEFPHNNFSVGDTFSSYKELEARVKLYEASHSVQLSHRDSRTLQGAKKRAPHRVAEANSDLLYYTIRLVCIFGGKKYQNRGTGERACQRYVCRADICFSSFLNHIFLSTIKQGCTAEIKLSLTEDGQKLIVTAVNESHNHELSKVKCFWEEPLSNYGSCVGCVWVREPKSKALTKGTFKLRTQ